MRIKFTQQKDKNTVSLHNIDKCMLNSIITAAELHYYDSLKEETDEESVRWYNSQLNFLRNLRKLWDSEIHPKCNKPLTKLERWVKVYAIRAERKLIESILGINNA